MMVQTLALLDQPLGTKAGRAPKVPKSATAAAVVVTKEKKVEVAAVVDPELANKIAEEEEKRKKRAAKYGASLDQVRRLPSSPLLFLCLFFMHEKMELINCFERRIHSLLKRRRKFNESCS